MTTEEQCVYNDQENEGIRFESECEQLTIFCEPIFINTENVGELQFDKEEFNKGLLEASYIAGVFTGLINCGFDHDSATNYLFAKLNCEMNIKISKNNTNAQIEASKNQSFLVEKTQI